MSRSIIAEKRALSPVIATVILISVTIVVAVSVAYWMGSIASGYTTFEQIELPTVYAKDITSGSLTYDSTFVGWNVTIKLKNTGSADATIDDIFINDVPLEDYDTGTVYLYVDNCSATTQVDGNWTDSLSSLSIDINKGESKTLYLYIKDDSGGQGVDGCTSGTTVNIKIHTASGRDYPTHVKLP
ncbi:type IV pilin [Candidatus Bathyarchaeota archaeon]|nr:MAG: type IV pilin [Candidatus Bathyarchaeota archaeon]